MKKRWIALLCALCLLPLPAPAYAQEPQLDYPDIAGDEWFVAAVEEMTAEGSMTGVEDAVFGPYEPGTRATLITCHWRCRWRLGGPGCGDAGAGVLRPLALCRLQGGNGGGGGLGSL